MLKPIVVFLPSNSL